MLVIKEGTNGFEGTDSATRQLIIEALEKEGLTIRSTEQDKSYLAANSQKAIDEAFSKRNQQLEDTVKELTGIEKSSASEKYYDYFKRAIEIKSKDLTMLQAKIKEYEEKGTNGNVLAEEYKKQVQTLQVQLKTARDEFATQLAEKGQEIFKTKFVSLRDQAIAKIKSNLRGDIAAEVIDDIVAAKIAKFESEYVPKEVEGITMFYDKAGNPVMDKKDGKPKTIEQLMTETFGTYIDDKKQQGGAGSGKPNVNQVAGNGSGTAPKAWKESKMPETVKSKVGLNNWIGKELKLTYGTPEFDEAFKHFESVEGKPLPLREPVA